MDCTPFDSFHVENEDGFRSTKRTRKEKRKKGVPQTQAVPHPVNFRARSEGQRHLISALNTNRLVFGVGPAGTGKTLLAVSRAVDMLLEGEVERIVLSRPAVSSDEEIGFLPGGTRDKLDPYLRPLYDAITEKLGGGVPAKRQLDDWLKSGRVEIGPIGFLRGRTFKRCVVVFDEAQNATFNQLKMVLTRIGDGSSMFVTGDPNQSDLPVDLSRGFTNVVNAIARLGKYPIVILRASDIQRDVIVEDVVAALS